MAGINRRTVMLVGAGLLSSILSVTPAWADKECVTDESCITVGTHIFTEPDNVPLALDIYKPTDDAKQPLPVIVFVHGGGWRFGNRETAPDLKRYFAQDGFAMVSIDYRLTPSITFPDNLEDVRTSIRWLRQNADSLGIDAQRIGLWGSSAGGHLASLAGLVPAGRYEGTLYRDQSSAVACVLDAYGPTALDLIDRQLDEEKPDREPVAPGVAKLPNSARQAIAAGNDRIEIPADNEDPKSLSSLLLGAPPGTVPERVKAANPITYVSSQAPPFLIMHGLSDKLVPYGQSIMLYEALAKADANVSLRLVHNLPHSFFYLQGIDETTAAPYRTTVRTHRPGQGETRSEDSAGVFDMARSFFQTCLQ